MQAILQRAFTVGILAAIAMMVAWQGFMIWWTKRQAGEVPKPIKWLRGINIGILLTAALLIVIEMARD